MDAKQTRFRVLMFPWLGHGHVFRFLELAKRLSKRNFHIYFCSTPIILDSIRKNLSKLDSPNDEYISIELIELHLPSSPDLPSHYHTPKNAPPSLLPTLMNAFQNSSSTFSDIIANLKPDLLLYDVMQPWAARIGQSLGIPSVHFATSSSTVNSFALHRHIHKNSDTFPYQAIWLRESEKNDIIAQGRSIKVKGNDESFLYAAFDLSREIVFIKGCRAFEGKYMDYLSTLCKKKIVPAGPLITHTYSQEINDDSESIMDWLSQKGQSSTLYIAFGSENYFSKEQMAEIAKGLELSNVNFIWVARSPLGSEISIEEVLPEGFLERVRERGRIVQKWVPQNAILAHPSVGGFMSHCGWSSVIESAYFGVPVVALPLKLDQPVNARLVVESGVGVEVVRDENGRFDGEAVAKAVNEVIVEESGEGLRKKARELSEKMKMEEGEAVDEVVEDLTRICLKK